MPDWRAATLLMLAILSVAALRRCSPGAEGAVSLLCGERLIRLRLLSPDPVVRVLDDFLSSEEARTVVDLARKGLRRSMVHSARGLQITDHRTSTTCELDAGAPGSTLECVERRAALIMGLPLSFLETLQVVHYEASQEFKAHHDWFSDDAPSGPGNRSHTIFVFLNDLDPEDEGGCTWFQQLDLRVKPKVGRAIHWFNCSGDEQRTCDARLMHAGLPPQRSQKWGLNIWGRTCPWRTGRTPA